MNRFKDFIKDLGEALLALLLAVLLVFGLGVMTNGGAC